MYCKGVKITEDEKKFYTYFYPVKYTCNIIIHLPRQRVAELFSDPGSLPHRMPGFERAEPVSGKPETQTRLFLKAGSRKMVMMETILRHQLPDEYAAAYEVNQVYNEVRHLFTALPDGTTRYTTESYFRFSGVMKLCAPLLTGVFRKTSQRNLARFKAYAEQHG